jgi:iron complex transport system ATP-binding protein
MSTPVHEPSCRRDLDGVVATAHRLVLRYGDHTAMDTSTFVIPTHAVTAVIGPNGSGKSTVLNALAGLVEPASGTLQVLGSDPADVRRRVSYVLQSVTVAAGTPITVAETVGMGRYPNLGLWRRRSDTDRHRVRTAMERLAITGLEHKHLTELSGGQRQRVYVAQGIAQGHEVLLLDEPLTGLDLVSARTIDDIIHSERDRGCSVILTTHDLEEARAADHVLLMNGRVVASGPPEEVLTLANLESAYGLGAIHKTVGAFVDDPAHPREPGGPPEGLELQDRSSQRPSGKGRREPGQDAAHDVEHRDR